MLRISKEQAYGLEVVISDHHAAIVEQVVEAAKERLAVGLAQAKELAHDLLCHQLCRMGMHRRLLSYSSRIASAFGPLGERVTSNSTACPGRGTNAVARS